MRRLVFLIFFLVSACVTAPSKPCAPAEMKALDKKGLQHWVIYKPPGRGFSMLFIGGKKLVAKTHGHKFVKDIPLTDAYVAETEKGKAPRVPAGWKVQAENIFYTRETLYRMTPVESKDCDKPVEPGPGPIANSTWGQKAVRAAEASALVDASSIKVCDIDTGLDSSVFTAFPQGSIKNGASYISGQTWDHDGGKHGTHTAGTIGSIKYGVARVSLYICKGLSDQGSGTSSALGGCVNQCRAWGAQIINASWGMDSGTDSFIGSTIDAFVNGGGIFVAAAGNSSGPIGFPGNKANVKTATAMTEAGGIASFSSRGMKVGGEMFIAPGVNVLSTVPGGTGQMSGTSMATPHLTAIYAIALAKGKRAVGFVNRNLQPSEQGKGGADALLTAQ